LQDKLQLITIAVILIINNKMKHKLIGKMYGILLELEEEYKEKSIKEDLYTFSRIRCDELF